jgi:hypothetical protein
VLGQHFLTGDGLDLVQEELFLGNAFGLEGRLARIGSRCRREPFRRRNNEMTARKHPGHSFLA